MESKPPPTSTGRRARSWDGHPVDAQQIPVPQQSKTPQVRSLPPLKGIELEVYRTIQKAFDRADVAARAAARFERDIHERMQQLRTQEGYLPEDAGEMPKVFDKNDFSDTFRRYNQLYLELAIIDLLELQDQKEAILQQRLPQIFSEDRGGKRPKTKNVFVGSSEAALRNQVQRQRQQGL